MRHLPLIAIALILVAGLLTPWIAIVYGRPRSPIVKKPPEPPAKLAQKMVVNESKLPALEKLLEELEAEKNIELLKFLPNLIKMGVVDTRLLLRLQPMDYRVMGYEWEGMQYSYIMYEINI